MKPCLISAAVAVVVGFPLGWILTMLATPLLWSLEPVLHMELAGHSGPSDWLFYVGWAIVIPAIFVFAYFLLRRVEPTCGRNTLSNEL